jgi:hypothetical protein
MWTLRNGTWEAAIHLRPAPRVGAKIVLTVDGAWRRTRLFWSHEHAEMVGAIPDTRAMFEGKEWK